MTAAMRVAVVGLSAAQEQPYRSMLKDMRIAACESPDDAEAVAVVDAMESLAASAGHWRSQGKRLLCHPALPVGGSVPNASHLRFIPLALRVRELVRAGGLGDNISFSASISPALPDWAGQPEYWTAGRLSAGVLGAVGADVIDLLGWWLGPLQVHEYADDSLGGVEAEATIRLQAGRARGTIELSRLRKLGNAVSVRGDNGRIIVDLEKLAIAAEPARLLAGSGDARRVSLEVLQQRRLQSWLSVDAGAPEMWQDSGVATTVAACRRGRRRLAHPWESGASRTFNDLSGKRVLVLGGTGFIGARLVERLCESGAKVTVALRSGRRAARLGRLAVTMVFLKRGGREELLAAVGGQEIVFNLAYDLGLSGRANVRACHALANACANRRIRRMVHVSSIAVYDGWPTSHLDEQSPCDSHGHEYKNAKRAIERDLQIRSKAGEFEAVIVQPTIVYGPYSRLWTDNLVERMRMGTVSVPGHGAGLCNGVHVDDVADMLMAAAVRANVSGESFIATGPEPFPWGRLLECYAGACNGQLVLEPETADAVHPQRMSAARPAIFRAVDSMRSAALRFVVASLKRGLGEDRVEHLRAWLLARSASDGRAYRLAAENPNLFTSQAACSVAKASRLLVPPAIDAGEGMVRTAAYIRWRYGSGR